MYREIKSLISEYGPIRILATRKLNEDKRWDSFIAHVAGGRYEQTSIWAQVKKVEGWQPIRIIFMLHNEIVAGFQILTKKKLFLGSVGYISKGPVVKNENRMMIELVVSQLMSITKISRIKLLIIQPPNYSQVIYSHLIQNGFLHDNITNAVSATTRVDLIRDLNMIFNSMSASTKRNIKIGQRKGLKVREGAFDDIVTFFKLMTESCRRQNVSPSPGNIHFFRVLYRKFSPKGYVKILILEYDSEVISSIMAIPFGETVYIYKIGWSGRFGNCRPNDFIHWELVKWAKLYGYKFLDFVGIDPMAATAICHGNSLPKQFKQTVTSFKLGFGGQALLLSKPCVYVYNPFFKLLYKHVLPMIISLQTVQRLIHKTWKASK